MVTAEEARRIRTTKGSVNHDTYKSIFLTIEKRIKQAAARGATSIQYRIPPLIPGRPMYKIKHAVRYNRDKLQLLGFEVLVEDDVLTVDWKQKPPVKEKKPQPAQPAQPAQPVSSAAARSGPKLPKSQQKSIKTVSTNTFDTGFKTSSAITQKLQNLKLKLKL